MCLILVFENANPSMFKKMTLLHKGFDETRRLGLKNEIEQVGWFFF